MNNKLLPIGSIIKVHDSDLYFMINGYVDRNKKIEDEYFDYFCCIYPMGIDGTNSVLVNKDKIEKVIFIGYQDDKFEKFIELLNNK